MDFLEKHAWWIAILAAILVLSLVDSFAAPIRRRLKASTLRDMWQRFADRGGYNVAHVEGHGRTGAVIEGPAWVLTAACVTVTQDSGWKPGLADDLLPTRRNTSTVVLDTLKALPWNFTLSAQKVDKRLASVLDGSDADSDFLTLMNFSAEAQPLLAPEHAETRREILRLMKPRDISVSDAIITWRRSGILEQDDAFQDVVERMLRLHTLLEPVFTDTTTAG